jgi:phosphoribosylaminoimidazole-succinocarboxamide synthase
MGLENSALSETHNLPIKHDGEVHSGKVRSVYWLTSEDSRRLVDARGYPVRSDTGLGVMIDSDRISAFNVNWKAENGLMGVIGKGACLNITSQHWFERFDKEGLAGNHILDVPHPLVWIVQKADPIMIEAIARQYITGSMWGDYSEGGVRNFCGHQLPPNLTKNQRLTELLITPTTKGILKGIPGVPEKDDANITREDILSNYFRFGFHVPSHVVKYEQLLRGGFELIARESEAVKQLFVDTKFEFGYVRNDDGSIGMIYIDEVGTLDSSRYWPRDEYEKDPVNVTEESKEGFRQYLIGKFGKKLMTGKEKDVVTEKKRIAAEYRVPVEEFMKVSDTYRRMTEKLTGKSIPEIHDARGEILDTLTPYGIVA